MMGSVDGLRGRAVRNPFYHIIRHGIYLLLGRCCPDAAGPGETVGTRPALLVAGMAILALLVPGIGRG
jgi:hypothetical protein